MESKMIELNESKMTKAIEKARTVKPLVRISAWRKYEVTNKQTGATYAVEFDVVNGRRMASCTCAAGQGGRFVCYHIAASAGVHLMIAAKQAA
jgi:hypothetical protein